MTPKPDSRPDKTRRSLLLWAWGLLALSLVLCLAGPRLTQTSMPPGIGHHHTADSELAGIGWVIIGMILGALALMCFVAQWVLRSREEGVSPQEDSSRQGPSPLQ